NRRKKGTPMAQPAPVRPKIKVRGGESNIHRARASRGSATDEPMDRGPMPSHVRRQVPPPGLAAGYRNRVSMARWRACMLVCWKCFVLLRCRVRAWRMAVADVLGLPARSSGLGPDFGPVVRAARWPLWSPRVGLAGSFGGAVARRLLAGAAGAV